MIFGMSMSRVRCVSSSTQYQNCPFVPFLCLGELNCIVVSVQYPLVLGVIVVIQLVDDRLANPAVLLQSGSFHVGAADLFTSAR